MGQNTKTQEWEYMNDSHTVHTVLIEWDGNRPPTRWYNRLDRMGLHVAGDKSTSPLARRQSGRGVIHQEGAILVETESEARILAHMARNCGAVAVTVGLLEIHETSLTEEDMRALTRIQQTLGKRGRPSEEKNWVVTCRDCMHTEQISATTPVNCPHCGSFVISYREGNRVTFKPVPVHVHPTTLFEVWLNSRFITGSFEVPLWDGQNGTDLPNAKPVFFDNNDALRTAAVSVSPALGTVQTLLTDGTFSGPQALQALDEAYRSLYVKPELRQRTRLEGLQRYFVSGGQQDGILLTSDPKTVDIFDILERLPRIIPVGKALRDMPEVQHA